MYQERNHIMTDCHKTQKNQKIQKKNQNMKLKFLKLTTAFLCIIALTGCNAKANTDINLNEDGTGSVSIDLSIPSAVFKPDGTETSTSSTTENTQPEDTSAEDTTNPDGAGVPTNGIDDEDTDASIDSSSESSSNTSIEANENDESKTQQLFTEAELRTLLKQRFKDFKIKKSNDKKYVNYKISANYNNKQVQNFIDSYYSIKNSGIGHKYSFTMPFKDFLPLVQNNTDNDEKNT